MYMNHKFQFLFEMQQEAINMQHLITTFVYNNSKCITSHTYNRRY